MPRSRMAGDTDRKGRLNAVASQLLNELKGTDRYTKSRFIDEVFPERVTLDNAEETLLALAPRTKVTINPDGTVTGGDAVLDSKGRVNLDSIPYDSREIFPTAPDSVNSDSSPQMRAMLFPESVAVTPALKRAHSIGTAMMNNDPAAYRQAGMPIEVDDDAVVYIADRLTKGGRSPQPLRSTGFVKSGGVGTASRGQILIPGTNIKYNDADKQTQSSYLDRRRNALVGQWLRQGGGSIGNPSTVIVPPGKHSHMDHIQSLSSSIDTVGPGGWGYSDGLTNYSYLDELANVHSKLNYSIQGQHLMMRQADIMRKQGLPFPARLSQSELGDPNRKRLSDEEGAIRLVTDKATDPKAAGERLLDIMQYLERNKKSP